MSGRPQVGIERLPARRMSNEPRESMNCKSCRKRKIKCNRLRPTCEACQVFQCPCVYDAVPKKRGPKTDVLEALLKRVDGLERRLKDEKKSPSPKPAATEELVSAEVRPKRPRVDVIDVSKDPTTFSPTPVSESPGGVQPDALLNTYFARCHGKAFYILDEISTHQLGQLHQLPSFLLSAVYAVSARYTLHPNGYEAAVALSASYTARSRAEIDMDEPTIHTIQALLLLSVAFTASGSGKKAYMMLSTGIGMILALELHREADRAARLTPIDREMRRRLFWTAYTMDRFMACGSKRPLLISDKSIMLRLPSWSPNPASMPIEGEFFQNGSNLQYHSGSGKKTQGSSGMLIDIVRILGITNRYLVAGGVKGDSHFPWHSLSNLSKIRQDLDIWASGTADVFTSLDALFGQVDSTTLVLAKLIYHLIHCLIYRPFLPIDLAELAGTGQHQSWQIEATNLCFLHANAIAELVELGKQSASIEWPAFVGYCICTAGTVHVHGAHYKGAREGEVFSVSTEFLTREMHQLGELRFAWSSVQHQRDILSRVYGCHSDLLEDFFDRYSDLGQSFDGAHISFSLIQTPNSPSYTGHDLYAPRSISSTGPLGTRHMSSYRRDSSKPASKKIKLSSSVNGSNNREAHGMVSPIDFEEHNSSSNQTLLLGRSTSMHEGPLTPFPGTSPNAMPRLSQTPFSPPYSFTALPGPEPTFDTMFGVGGMPSSSNNGYNYTLGDIDEGAMGDNALTPGARSQGESTGSNGEEKDPFLSLLEQLAENEHSRGGPSELDFFLGGGNSSGNN